jgi:hypothetical protein
MQIPELVMVPLRELWNEVGPICEKLDLHVGASVT